MPAGLLPDEGIGELLKYWTSTPIPGVADWYLMLWVNDIEVNSDTTLTDLEEATWSGYMQKTLTRADWKDPEVAAGCATTQWGDDSIIWNVGDGEPQTNYGVAYVDPSTAELRFVQRFDNADIAPIEVGGKFLLLPKLTLTSHECTSVARATRLLARKKRKETQGG